MAEEPTRKTQQPEALATFGAAARKGGKKPDDVGLNATSETRPIPTDSEAKDEAATRVLQEGACGGDRNADEAVKRLPDRARADSQSTQGR